MTRAQFLNLIDDIVEEAPGTIRGDEKLQDIKSWDSLAVVSFIAAIHQHFELTLAPDSLKKATSIPDLVALLGDRIKG